MVHFAKLVSTGKTIQDQEDLLLKYLMNVIEEGMALIQVVSELKDGNDY